MSREDKDTGCGRALRAWEAHLGGGAMPLASGFIARWSRFDFRLLHTQSDHLERFPLA